MIDLKHARIVFIGAGNMAEALVKGLLSGGVCAPEQVTVTDVREERLEHFRKTFGVQGSASNETAARQADVLVLAVKPQQMRDVMTVLASTIGSGALVISIAAGVLTKTMEALLPGARVVRVMPNTPALVSAGVSAVCRGSRATEEDAAVAGRLLGSVGTVVNVNEDVMDAVTAVSGSGPAYVFFLMEAMQAAAVKLGLDADTARQLVNGTVAGAARLAEESGVSPADLRERVTSKGGTTAAALDVLRAKHVAEAWIEAIAAAHRRSQELSRG